MADEDKVRYLKEMKVFYSKVALLEERPGKVSQKVPMYKRITAEVTKPFNTLVPSTISLMPQILDINIERVPL